MSYESELLNDQFTDNVVLRINGGDYFAKREPDSGLVIAPAYCIVKAEGGLTINQEIFDLLEGDSSFPSNTFTLVDLDWQISALKYGDPSNFIGQLVEIWLGRSGVSMPFSDYLKIADTYITGATFQNEEWTFTTQAVTSQFRKPIFNTQSPLAADTAAGAATIVCDNSISDFPTSGKLFIDDEFLPYTSKNNGTKTFTLTGTSANDHSSGAVVYNVTTITTENPVDILLRVLQSTSGGTYDDYAEGLGLADSVVDIDAFETIRDDVFTTDTFSFELYGIENALDWIRTELLKPNSLRFITSATSKLSITVLDASIFGDATREIDSDAITPASVRWSVDKSMLRNKVTFNYAYSHETGKFTKSLTVTDSSSITTYGETEAYIVDSKGTTDSATGDAIATDRTTRWLARFSVARPKVNMEVFMRHATTLIGERVLVTYDLPTEGGGRAFYKEMEVLSKGLNTDRGIVSLEFGYTNYTGLREGYISPADFTVGYDAGAFPPYLLIPNGNGGKYKVDWVVDIYDEATWTLQQAGLIITAITTGPSGQPDTIEFNGQEFTFSGSNFIMQFADYGSTILDQKRYASLSNGTSNFLDASAPYQVTF